MAYLILVRHGESRWNRSNKFTGWVDVPLSEVGIHEALITASKLKGLKIDVAFTSKLARAQQTLLLILSEQDKTGIFLHDTPLGRSWSKHNHGKDFTKDEIPIHSSADINERYYGDLQGMDKDEARKQFGEDQVFIWRRSYNVKPPKGESLQDVCKRAIPYLKQQILPELKAGKNVIVSAHGNSLRGIIKHLDGISDRDIPHLELPYATPIVYEHKDGKLTKENHIHDFNRPVHWQRQRPHHPYRHQKKTSAKKK